MRRDLENRTTALPTPCIDSRKPSPASPSYASTQAASKVRPEPGPKPGEATGKLVVTGSSTVAPLVLEIAKRFETLHPDVRIDVQTGGSSRGIADAGSGLADIGMASRPLDPTEQAGLQAHAIAQDGVGLIVHATNPVTELTDEEVRRIFTGEASNWSEVGGADAEIVVVNKAAGRATLEVFRKYFGLEESEIQPDVVIGDNEQGVKTVAGSPHAVGYVSIGTAEYGALHDVPIRLLPCSGVAATTANVGAGRFPISRPLNLITQPGVSELAREFIDFCQSEAVHDLVTDLYFVPIRSEAVGSAE